MGPCVCNHFLTIFSPVFPVLGKDKLGVPASEPVRLVLECDGTQVEDGEYFRTLANNTVLLLLRQGERWYPTGVDVIKAGKQNGGSRSAALYSYRRPPYLMWIVFFFFALSFPISLFSLLMTSLSPWVSHISNTKDRLRDYTCVGAAG